jgi:hypothetical protein
MKNMPRAGASKRTMYALELADRRTYKSQLENLKVRNMYLVCGHQLNE